MKTSLLVETQPHPTGHLVRALLRIEGEPPKDGEGHSRRVPLNLSLVLDRSGSMGGGKLEAVKRAARDLIRRLHPDDHVSVVAFDDEVFTVAQPGTAAEQPELLDALMGIETGGCTNLSGGWLQGRALAQLHHDAEGVNRVILLTDGLANTGITDAGMLHALCSEGLNAKVSTTTVGVGADYDEDLLAALAEGGGGSTYYIERLDQAGGVFEEELEGLLSIAAQNLTVTLRARDAVQIAQVHHGYPSQLTTPDTLCLFVGDLYAREPREVLCDFLVASEGAAGEADDAPALPIADLELSADVWAVDGSMERRKISLPLTFEPGRGAVAHPEVQKVFTLLEVARARREAVERGDRGDARGAAAVLREASVQLGAVNPDDAMIVREVQDLCAMADTLETQAEMNANDRKYMYTKARMESHSRRSARERLSRE